MGRFFAFFLLLGLAVLTQADGLYAKFGNIGKPTMPYQRAIIANRHGLETLIVESELNGAPGDYAWIVPIPNPPTKILEVFPQGMDRSFRRQNQGSLYFGPIPGSCYFGAILIAFGITAAVRASKKGSVEMLLFGVLVLIIYSCVFPMFAQAKTAAKGGVETLQSMDVGSYHVDVVRSKSPSELSSWFVKHGGQVPAEALDAVREYVKEGWCFMVAKLDKSSGQGLSHPLAVSFPSKATVYPMRLTLAQGNPVIVDLLVIADSTAIASPLRIWKSQRISDARLMPYDEDSLASAPAEALAWKGCTITRLRGEMKPKQMTRDIDIQQAPYAEQALRVSKVEFFRDYLLGIVASVAGIACFLVGILCGFFGIKKKVGLGLTCAVALIAAGVVTYNEYAEIQFIEPGVLAATRPAA